MMDSKVSPEVLRDVRIWKDKVNKALDTLDKVVKELVEVKIGMVNEFAKWRGKEEKQSDEELPF